MYLWSIHIYTQIQTYDIYQHVLLAEAMIIFLVTALAAKWKDVSIHLHVHPVQVEKQPAAVQN